MPGVLCWCSQDPPWRRVSALDLMGWAAPERAIALPQPTWTAPKDVRDLDTSDMTTTTGCAATIANAEMYLWSKVPACTKHEAFTIHRSRMP